MSQDHRHVSTFRRQKTPTIGIRELALFNIAIGFCMGIAVSSALLLLDLGSLKTLLLQTERPDLAIVLLYVFNGLTGAAFNASIECALNSVDRTDKTDTGF